MSTDGPPPGPPWIRPEMQQDIVWRDGDVVISVPPKSGTTWTMNIVYQLFEGGTDDFRDVYEEVPWIEFLSHPGESLDAIHDRLAAMPTSKRRAFKTHSAPPVVPFVRPGSGRDVKYLVVFRNPEEALVSFWPFLAKHSNDWADRWGMPHDALRRPDFHSFFREIVEPGKMHTSGFFDFLNAWWPLRNESNVLFIHYNEMKRDHGGMLRKIAKFLEIEPDAEQWGRIEEYTSFAWMKENEEKFDTINVQDARILERGAMIRKGQIGKAQEDGMTPQIARELRAAGEASGAERDAIEWFYSGS